MNCTLVGDAASEVDLEGGEGGGPVARVAPPAFGLVAVVREPCVSGVAALGGSSETR
jgi:hypothetical protein